MRKFFILAGAALALISCQKAPETIVRIQVEGTSPDTPVRVVTTDSTYTAVWDSTGMAVLNIAPDIEPGYGEVAVDRVNIPVYIEPGKSFDLLLKFEGRRFTPEFKGEGARINEYLNGDSFRSFYPDFKAGEDDFIALLEEQENKFVAALDSFAFGAPFGPLEKKRLHYLVYELLAMYPSYHAYYAQVKDFKPSARYYEAFKAAVSEDESLIQMKEYQEALAGVVNVFAEKGRTEKDRFDRVKKRFEYIEEHIQSPLIAEYLVHRFASGYVSQEGIDHLDEIMAVYNAKVKDAGRKAAFDELISKWKRIAKGQPSPDFKYPGIEGKEVSLADLAGKYVFIDVWATWCGPCRNELPALKKLEHQFQGKNIAFVSISCDQDKAAWEKMVKTDNLGGIQLIAGPEDDEFMKGYMITTIPRFILLDQEGKILVADMTRPSNPETAIMLNGLAGL